MSKNMDIELAQDAVDNASAKTSALSRILTELGMLDLPDEKARFTALLNDALVERAKAVDELKAARK